jgi:hypothetical protein
MHIILFYFLGGFFFFFKFCDTKNLVNFFFEKNIRKISRLYTRKTKKKKNHLKKNSPKKIFTSSDREVRSQLKRRAAFYEPKGGNVTN